MLTRVDEIYQLREQKGWSLGTCKEYFAKQDLITEALMADNIDKLRAVVVKLVERIHVSGMY